VTTGQNYHGDYWTKLPVLQKFLKFEGICRNPREFAGIRTNPRESEGISRNQRKSAGISRNWQEQTGMYKYHYCVILEQKKFNQE